MKHLKTSLLLIVISSQIIVDWNISSFWHILTFFWCYFAVPYKLTIINNNNYCCCCCCYNCYYFLLCVIEMQTSELICQSCNHLILLPTHLCIIFKISLMTYRTLATSNPPYLNHLIHCRQIPNHPILVHPPQFIFTNQSTDHRQSRLHLCLSCRLERPSPHHSSQLQHLNSSRVSWRPIYSG